MLIFGVSNHMYVRHVLNVGARLATLANALCANTLQDYRLFARGLCLCSPVGFLCFELKRMLSTIVFSQACSASTSLEEEVEPALEELPRPFRFRFRALLGFGTIPVAQTIRAAVSVLVSAPQRIPTSSQHFS